MKIWEIIPRCSVCTTSWNPVGKVRQKDAVASRKDEFNISGLAKRLPGRDESIAEHTGHTDGKEHRIFPENRKRTVQRQGGRHRRKANLDSIRERIYQKDKPGGIT